MAIVICALTKSELPEDPKHRRFIMAMCKYMYIYDNCLWYCGNTEELIPKILELTHEDAGHFGPAKTLALLKSRCYWPRMNQDVPEYCNTCDTCQRTKYSNQRPAGLMESNYGATRPWELICVDWIGPILPPAKNFKFILVVVDYYTRWVEAFPAVYKSAESFANILHKEVFTRNFYPRKILSDRDHMKLLGLSCYQLYCKNYEEL